MDVKLGVIRQLVGFANANPKPFVRDIAKRFARQCSQSA
jgi:hypothetical protein